MKVQVEWCVIVKAAVKVSLERAAADGCILPRLYTPLIRLLLSKSANRVKGISIAQA